jgi:hypothetical protein
MNQRQRFERAFKQISIQVMQLQAKLADYDEWKVIQELVAAVGQTTEDIMDKNLDEQEACMEVAQECGALIGAFSGRTPLVDDFKDMFLDIFKDAVDNPGRFEGNLKIGIAGGLSG